MDSNTFITRGDDVGRRVDDKIGSGGGGDGDDSSTSFCKLTTVLRASILTLILIIH